MEWRGDVPRRYWLSLPLWCPAGGARGRSPANLAFSFPFCPLSPQPPSPVGKGETQSLFCRGLRPRHPCIRPFAAPTATAKRAPRGQNPRGTGYPSRCGARRGACFVCRPPTMPLPSFLPPIPPPALAERSSPAGKGEPQSLFCRGLRPRHPCIRPIAAPTATAKRAPRGQNPRGTGYPCRCGALRGGAGGGHLLTLPLAFLLPPIPPPPLAGRSSPAGKGENQSFLMQGAPPLASSGLAPRGTGSAGVSGALRGRTGDGRRLALPPHVPGGGVPFSSPANPAFSVVFAPYPPSPLPRWGRGRPKVYFAGGFAPGTPAIDRLRHLQPLPSGHPGGRTRAALVISAPGERTISNAAVACDG